MSLVHRIKCWVKGDCEPIAEPVSPAIEQMRRNLEETVALKRVQRQIRETGIWPADMIRGNYRPERREHHVDE